MPTKGIQPSMCMQLKAEQGRGKEASDIVIIFVIIVFITPECVANTTFILHTDKYLHVM